MTLRAAGAPQEQPSDQLKTEIGRRLKVARLERGMTLAQLGGKDLSRSFLSSVEHGRTRISVRALSLVAGRLGLPLSYFLDSEPGEERLGPQLALAKAEVAMGRREPQEALHLLDTTDIPEDDAAQALYLRGWALLDSGRPAEAIPPLEAALTRATERQNSHQQLLAEYRLAVAHYLAGHDDNALTHFGSALQRLSGELDDPLLRGKITVCLGHIHYGRRDFAAAVNHYARARQLFGTVNDLDNLAGVYMEWSRVYEHKGEMQNALRYARMSAGIYEAQHNRRFAAHELNDIAAKYTELGQLSEALECAQHAIALAQESGARDVEARAHSSLAAIYFRQDEPAAAESEAERARAMASDHTDLAWIDATVILAKLADGQGDYATADQHFTAALEGLQKRGHVTAYANVAVAYSLALERRGELSHALRLALEAATARTS